MTPYWSAGNGRTIACISGGATLTVWGPYASRGCIPDFHQILQSPMLKLISIEHLDDQEEIVLKQIFEEFGPRIINYPDCYGLSLFMHAVILKKISWLKLMIDMSKECSVSCRHIAKVVLRSKGVLCFQSSLKTSNFG